MSNLLEVNIEDLIDTARYSISEPTWGPTVETHANMILANEYADFMEFMEDEVEDWEDVRRRFFIKQAQQNIKGYEKIGYPIQFEQDELKEAIMALPSPPKQTP